MIYFSFDVDITNSEEATVVATALKQLVKKNRTIVEGLLDYDWKRIRKLGNPSELPSEHADWLLDVDYINSVDYDTVLLPRIRRFRWLDSYY